jgi:septation ring formation regulator EzrA
VITDTETLRERGGGTRERATVNNNQLSVTRKLQRSLDAAKSVSVTLKKANGKLQREVTSLTGKLEKSQASVLSALSDQAAMKERLKSATSDDKQMREMITQYHTKVMAELKSLKEDVASVRTTPIEIVATHEHPPPPMSHQHQGTQCILE